MKVRGDFWQVSAEDLIPHLAKPLQKYAQDYVDAGLYYALDPRFLAAISKFETGHGTSYAFRKKNNAMGVSNSRGPISFESVRESIYHQARSLNAAKGYYAKANTVDEIAAIYSPPGAGNDPHGTNNQWGKTVGKFFKDMC